MATKSIRCSECGAWNQYSDTAPFKVICECGTSINSADGKGVWFDPSTYVPLWKRAQQPGASKAVKRSALKQKITHNVIIVSGVFILVAILIFAAGTANNKVSEYMSEAPSNSDQTSNIQQLHATEANGKSTSSTKANRTNIIIYSGACIYYQKIWVENNGEHGEHLKPISKGFAKAVFNRQKKTMYFYFNNKLVHTFKDYDSYMDDRLGGEGYSFDASADGHRFIAERVFQLNTDHLLSEPGFQYDIINYQEN